MDSNTDRDINKWIDLARLLVKFGFLGPIHAWDNYSIADRLVEIRAKMRKRKRRKLPPKGF